MGIFNRSKDLMCIGLKYNINNNKKRINKLHELTTSCDNIRHCTYDHSTIMCACVGRAYFILLPLLSLAAVLKLLLLRLLLLPSKLSVCRSNAISYVTHIHIYIKHITILCVGTLNQFVYNCTKALRKIPIKQIYIEK